MLIGCRINFFRAISVAFRASLRVLLPVKVSDWGPHLPDSFPSLKSAHANRRFRPFPLIRGSDADYICRSCHLLLLLNSLI